MSVAPDYVEPLGGWRLWSVAAGPGGVRLRSLFHEVDWPPGRALHAACMARRFPWLRRTPGRRRGHPAPEDGCTCGLYAARGEWLRAYMRRQGGGYVYGRVLLWGLVVECEQGWRAEWAYPERLYVPDAAAGDELSVDELVAELAVYGVPVEAALDRDPEELLAAS